MSEPATSNAEEIARLARTASAQLARFNAADRGKALNLIADELTRCSDDILRANELDCKQAAAAVEQGQLSSSLLKRLKLDADKLQTVIAGIRQVAQLPDPLGTVELARELDDGLTLYRKRYPIGVVLVIFEARPDALPQIAALLIKSGNAGLLKGGKEASASNEAIFSCIARALRSLNFPEGAYRLVPGREQVADLLEQDKSIDLVIPRGSGELVRHIQDSTKIPVLGHAEGICHLYVDEDADEEMSIRLAIDAKTNYPAACNAIETILLHRAQAQSLAPRMAKALIDAGVEVRMQTSDIERYGIKGAQIADESDWSCEYSDMIVSIKIVDSLAAAIEHINHHGSSHTDAIVTRDKKAFEIFSDQVNSAGVYWNASTRFADGFRYGFGAEVGISTGKLHPRGPVGIDGITTYKYILIGNGHTVADYVGESARPFTHKDLPLRSQ